MGWMCCLHGYGLGRAILRARQRNVRAEQRFFIGRKSAADVYLAKKNRVE